MYTQFGQKRLIPQVLVNLIWSYDDRNKILFRDCVDEMNKSFFINRLNERLRFELNIFNNYLLYPQTSMFNPYGYMSSHFNPTYSVYLLKRIRIFGDGVHIDDLPHFTFTPMVIRNRL